jgi:hypothetical protein
VNQNIGSACYSSNINHKRNKNMFFMPLRGK